jgi:transposase InsO family protein
MTGGLVDHSDRGVRHLSTRYTEWVAQAGIERSVGSAGDSSRFRAPGENVLSLSAPPSRRGWTRVTESLGK